MPGPLPQPTAIQALRGFPGKRRRKGEPKPIAGRPRPPADLPADVAAEFRRLVRELARVPGLLTRVDGRVLEHLAAVTVEWRKAGAAVRELGQVLVMRDDKGAVRYATAAPHFSNWRSLGAQKLALEDRVGLSPAARAKLGTVAAAPAAELEAGTLAAFVARRA